MINTAGASAAGEGHSALTVTGGSGAVTLSGALHVKGSLVCPRGVGSAGRARRLPIERGRSGRSDVQSWAGASGRGRHAARRSPYLDKGKGLSGAEKSKWRKVRCCYGSAWGSSCWKCFNLSFTADAIATSRDYLARRGVSGQALDRMHSAFTRSVMLHVTAWKPPYVAPENC